MNSNTGGELKRASESCILALLAFSAIPAVAQDPTTAAPPRTTRVVVVSIADRKLAVTEGGNVLAQFQIAVGARVSPSPRGEFTIVTRVANPSYYHGGTVIPTGKDNPVGTRWIGLSKKGYGIHGTNAPGSIGHAASHGCIRLRNRDMEQLFTMLQVGDLVQIHGERDEEVAQIFGTKVDDSVVASAQSAPAISPQDATSATSGLGN
jgi:lipoprotein-anchoring transpeptidase ErfK/SrfK